MFRCVAKSFDKISACATLITFHLHTVLIKRLLLPYVAHRRYNRELRTSADMVAHYSNFSQAPLSSFVTFHRHRLLTDCKVTFNTKISKIPCSSELLWALPQTPLYVIHSIAPILLFFRKNTYCTQLYFEFD